MNLKIERKKNKHSLMDRLNDRTLYQEDRLCTARPKGGDLLKETVTKLWTILPYRANKAFKNLCQILYNITQIFHRLLILAMHAFARKLLIFAGLRDFRN